MNECSACGEDFGSIVTFDIHRVGDFPQKGPFEYDGPLEDWTPEKGRRLPDRVSHRQPRNRARVRPQTRQRPRLTWT
jgi:hypothetical protein